MESRFRRLAVLVAAAVAVASGSAFAQQAATPPAEPMRTHPELTAPPIPNGGTGTVVTPANLATPNVHMLGHTPLGSTFTVSDVEIEQEVSRPFVYVSRMNGTDGSGGLSVLSIKDPSNPQVLIDWKLEHAELHRGMGAMDPKYFKIKGRYYVAQSMQWMQGGPDSDLGAVIFDVTGLPDVKTFREVARIRYPQAMGGFHNMFAYKHSDGRALLFTTTVGPNANVYDLEKVIANDPNALIGQVPVPHSIYGPGSYHDFYVGYDVATHQDKFYGAGTGGYYVFDVSKPETPALLTSVTAMGVPSGHTFTPTPDGRFAVAETEYQYAPLRIFDLKPGVEGGAINRPIGAWTANWENVVHNHEVRWPYVFVSGYEDGLQIFNMRDPAHPVTVGSYYTFDGPHNHGWGGVDHPDQGNNVFNGAFGVDVRNADGLIVVSDMTTGFWTFKLDGFNGWNGHRWGMPNISSAQDWDNGPEGAPKGKPVT